MTSIKKILVVIDPSAPSQPALERIAHLPRPVGAQLMLLICDYEPNLAIGHELAPASVDGVIASLLARHAATLNDLAAPLRAQGLDVLADARWDYPLHEGIIRKAVEWGADLVVKDTHHHSVLRRSIFSNTDWSLIRQCPMRLLLVKPRPLGHVACVVAAVDPLHPRDATGSIDERILISATEIARLLGGQTHVLHSLDVSPLLMTTTDGMMLGPSALPISEIATEIETKCTAAVRTLADKHGVPRERVYVFRGRARDVLVSTTRELRADVLVMGAVSRSALERLFIGSTAEAVLDRLSCDVLIVKPASGAIATRAEPCLT